METIKKKVQEVVNSIYEELGEVRPSELIERAKPKKSPIHEAFEWDDAKAGEEYRLMQARTWIRRVEIIIEEKAERFIHVPFVTVEGEASEFETRENYYKPASVVVQDQDEFQLALGETLARLNSAKAAYNQLKNAAGASKSKTKPDFKRADKGFGMVESALRA
jgi:hypothetical protein